ncbi:MAG: 50S ribosomal protein L1 [Candidatus Zixiibacteriota bacterium]
MAKHGKKYNNIAEKVDSRQKHKIKDAIELVKENSFANFDETVELSANLNVNPRHADQMVRGTLVLPNGTGQDVKVLVFAKGDKAEEAKNAGADYVGEEYAEKIQEGWLDFDVAIAAPNMMSVVGKLGRVLGPRGLMPNPKTGTVTMDIERAVKEAKAGKISFRVDKAGVVHAPVGKVSFDVEALRENVVALLDVLHKQRPASVKGIYFTGVTLSSTMGHGYKIDMSDFVAKRTP